jgi:hypothetical protein
MFAYHRAAVDGGALPTVKGYWRAPSIQAAIFDDSYHPRISSAMDKSENSVNAIMVSPVYDGHVSL